MIPVTSMIKIPTAKTNASYLRTSTDGLNRSTCHQGNKTRVIDTSHAYFYGGFQPKCMAAQTTLEKRTTTTRDSFYAYRGLHTDSLLHAMLSSSLRIAHKSNGSMSILNNRCTTFSNPFRITLFEHCADIIVHTNKHLGSQRPAPLVSALLP